MKLIKYIKQLTFILAVLLCATAEKSLALTVAENWDNSGLEGWKRSNANVALYNVEQALCVVFNHQTGPVFPSESRVFADAGASAALTGDYIEQAISKITLRFKAAHAVPGTLWLTLRCESGRTWHTLLEEPPVGEWVEYNAPLSTDAGWTYGPSSKSSEFLEDIKNVVEAGIFVRRSSAPAGEAYYIDDFTIEGATAPALLTVSGTVSYTGEQENGTIYIRALPVGGTATNNIYTSVASPGAFSLSPAENASAYDLVAYVDVNANDTQDNWEPAGLISSLAVHYEDVTGVELNLSDPVDAHGLPFWWLNQHFGGMSQLQGAEDGLPLALQDSDNDGLNNYGEYRALTDPLSGESVFKADITYNSVSQAVEVSWNSADTRQYTILRSGKVDGPYTAIASGIQGGAPRNTVLDSGISNGPFFYRVQIDP